MQAREPRGGDGRSTRAREVREAYGAYRSAYDIAVHHRDELVPLRKLIAEENVLRYNGMLIGVFELLADARLQIASVNASIEALRDFWLARPNLDMALIGKPDAVTRADPMRCRLSTPAAPATERRIDYAPQGQPHVFQTQFPRRRRRDHRGRLRRRRQQGRRWPPCPSRCMQDKPDTMPPLVPATGRPYNPVVTLNGWTLPWRMNQGVKEFHLVAEPVVREMTPGFKAHLWGYNGQSPGPTIEVVEGDRVRIFVTNKLRRAHQRALARPAPAQRHGRRDRADPARHRSPARPSSTSSSRGGPAPSCTTRMPTRWCRWRWA